MTNQENDTQQKPTLQLARAYVAKLRNQRSDGGREAT